MTDLLNEITFCDECPYSGEPNGCNRKEGVCKAYESYFDLIEENAALRERLEKAIELPFFQEDGEASILVYRDKNGIVCTEIYFEDEIYWGRYGDEAAEARLAELKGGAE